MPRQHNTTQIIEDYKNLKSTYKVAPLHNITANTVRNILLKEGVHLPSINDKHKHFIPVALEEYKNGVSMKQIELKYGITNSYFKKILKENGLEYINRAKNPSSGPIVYIKNNLKDLIEDYKITKNISLVAKKHKIKFEPLYRYFTENNLLIRKHQQIEITQEEIKCLYKMYVKDLINIQDISKIKKITPYNIKKILINNFGKEILRPKEEITRQMNYSTGFQENALSKSYYNKTYTLPSGKIIKVMGYEDHFLNFIFNKKIFKEEDFDFTNNFKINYMDGNKKRKYYPDFFIPKKNLIIEIKSLYILNKQKHLNDLKFEAAKKAGYNFICIVDKNYEEFLNIYENSN